MSHGLKLPEVSKICCEIWEPFPKCTSPITGSFPKIECDFLSYIPIWCCVSPHQSVIALKQQIHAISQEPSPISNSWLKHCFFLKSWWQSKLKECPTIPTYGKNSQEFLNNSQQQTRNHKAHLAAVTFWANRSAAWEKSKFCLFFITWNKKRECLVALCHALLNPQLGVEPVGGGA